MIQKHLKLLTISSTIPTRLKNEVETMEINININLNQVIFMVKPNTTRATRTKKFQESL